MKVSIITVCLNSEKTIEDCIDSVVSQDYENIEYIIIDGLSNDKTVNIIEKYKNNIDKFISESDNGIYDAFNKGIKVANGELIGILNSDDIFMTNTIISELVNKIIEDKADSIYADLVFVNQHDTNKIMRQWKSGPYSKNNFIYGWMPPNPTFFVKKKIFDKYGFYNLTFGSAADYEILIRFMYRFGISSTYFPKIVTKMRLGGVSTYSFSNRFKAHIQDWNAWIKNDISNFPIWVLLKPLRKIYQYF